MRDKRFKPAFADLPADSSLLTLSEGDRFIIWNLLVSSTVSVASGPGQAEANWLFSYLSALRETSAQALSLASGLDIMLSPKTPGIGRKILRIDGQQLREDLLGYAKNARDLGRSVSRQTNPRDFLETRLLVMLSEFVYWKTGKYCDKEIQLLAQTITDLADGELSDEAIRKRRERFKKDYPKQFAALRIEVRRWKERAKPKR